MARDEAAVGLTEQLTDTHLAERARFGERFALRELYRRHAASVAALAVAVTGRPDQATHVVVHAFPQALDRVATGTYSLEDPFLPCLLRTARQVALAADGGTGPDAAGLARSLDPATDLAAVARLFGRLDEQQRSALFLDVACRFDAVDVALALAVPEATAGALVAAARAALGAHIDGAAAALDALSVPLTLTTEADTFARWRRWAESDATAEVTEDAARVPLVVRIQPAATRVLRGAAAVVFLAGTVVAFGDHGGSSGTGPSAHPEAGAAKTIDTPRGTSAIDLAASHAPSAPGSGTSSAPAGPLVPVGGTGSISGSPSTGGAGTLTASGGGGGITASGATGAPGSGTPSATVNPTPPAGTPTPPAPIPSGPTPPPTSPPPTSPPPTSPPPTTPPPTPPPTTPPSPTPPPTTGLPLPTIPPLPVPIPITVPALPTPTK